MEKKENTTPSDCSIHPDGGICGTEAFCFGCPAGDSCGASFKNTH